MRRSGFILDGFPRTQTQAEALTRLMNDLGTPLDAVVLFEVGDEELVRRISGRRTCSLCNKVFNIHTAPPPSPATDCVPDSNEHQLFQRKDDEEATVAERLRVYARQTQPVLSYYSDAGLLRTVRAEGALAGDHAAPARCARGADEEGRELGRKIVEAPGQATPGREKESESREPAQSRGARRRWRSAAQPTAKVPRKRGSQSGTQGEAPGAPRAPQVKAPLANARRRLPCASRAAG